MVLIHILLDSCIISRIADIDYRLHDIIQSGIRFFQQGFDVFEHTGSLFHDIAGMYDFSVSVDAGRARYKNMATVAICDSCAPFERNTIFICAVQVFGSI